MFYRQHEVRSNKMKTGIDVQVGSQVRKGKIIEHSQPE